MVRYDQAERLCHEYGLQLAIIDNLPLLEKLKEMNMCSVSNWLSSSKRRSSVSSLVNTTCKGQCPQARGYYIGLKRLMNDDTVSESEWIWSNNVTWKQNETEVCSCTRFRSLPTISNNWSESYASSRFSSYPFDDVGLARVVICDEILSRNLLRVQIAKQI